MLVVTISVALEALRAAAVQLTGDAEDLAEMPWPAIAPTALSGSAVGAVDTSDGAARLAAVVDAMRAWADTARSAAEAFEQADARAAGGLTR